LDFFKTAVFACVPRRRPLRLYATQLFVTLSAAFVCDAAICHTFCFCCVCMRRSHLSHFCSFFRMQIDTRVFTPFTLHYSASAAAAAASPISKMCSNTAADHSPAAAADETDSGGDGSGGDGESEQPLVFVTAASSDFFNNSLNLIGRCGCARACRAAHAA
jgi:hypothetical protein